MNEQTILVIISFCISNFMLIVQSMNDAPLRVDIIEESPTGSIIPGVAEYLQQLLTRQGLTSTTTTTFQLINDGTFSNLFNLDPNTGRLIIGGRIDREALCPLWDNSVSASTQRNPSLIDGNEFVNSSPNECIKTLNILIISRSNQQHSTIGVVEKHVEIPPKTTRILIHVVIHDINDNAPRWNENSVLHVSFVETPSSPNTNGWNTVQTILRPVQENDAIRHAKSIDRAYDPDMGQNGTIVYRLIGPGADYFRLADNLNKKPTNDNNDQYHIQSNTDLLSHRKTDLTMDLYNINNNNNGNLNPIISSTHETPIQIWPILPLDRETKDFAGQGGIYNLTLLASDLGNPPKSTSIPLLITLIDVNDHIPQFHNPANQYEVNHNLNLHSNQNNNPLESNYVIYRPLNGNLRETLPIGSFVLQLNASDQDDGLHSKLVYGFCPCDRNVAQNYFKIDSITGRITVSHLLDYDNGPRQFRFKVIAKDSAPEPYTLTGTAIVEIMLADENDETPQINVMLLQRNSVYDTSSSTTTTTHHSFLSNKIKQNSNGAKLLREFTTTINENPQPETVIAYVQVYDPDHHGQDHIHCRLGPTDNFTLQYDPSSTSTSLTSISSTGSGGSSSSSSIGSNSNSLLFLTKRNSFYDNSIQRSLTNSVQNKQDYRLITGTRLTDLSSPYSSLDREITPIQTITLTCTDSVDNSAYVIIHVQLSDLNDNAPEFVNNGHFVFQLSENQELPGNKPIWLGRTIAVDNDQGVNALITYRLENDEYIESGVENKDYEMTDSDTKSYMNMNMNNNLNNMFELNSQTGDLYVKVVFDRETAPNDGVYRFKVLCIDSGEPALTGTAQVEVFILDENDWPPQFTREVYTFSVPENMRIHETVGEVEAIDRDADSKGKITYQLITHSYQPVNELTDWVLSSASSSSHRLHSRALENKLNGNNELASVGENTEFNQTLNNELNKSKQFNRTSKQSFEAINSQQDELKKTTVSSMTNDIKPMNRINYSHSEKLSTMLNYFTVDRLTGKIRLIRTLDRESVALFTVEIVAIDSAPISPIISLRQINSMMSTTKLTSGSNNNNFTLRNTYNNKPVHKSLSSTATVVIAVTDINDNPPIFRRPNTSTAIQLSMHETLGRQLLTMEATDADEGENARITYQIRSEVPRPPGGSGTGHFAIDESSGMLFIARPFNTTTTHRFVVEACDGGIGPSRRCTLSPVIRINVFDSLNEPLSNSNNDLLVYQTGTSLNHDNFQQNHHHRKSDLSFDLDEFTVGSVMAVQNGRRNEIVVVCLVVLFSILLMATILLVICLIHRRGLTTRQWIVNRSENLTSDKEDCKKEQNIVNKTVNNNNNNSNNNPNNRSNIDLWMENQLPDEQSELRTDMKLESKSPLQYGMTNISVDGKIQTYGGHDELNSPTRILSNNTILNYHPHPQPTIMSPLISDLQQQQPQPQHIHSQSLVNQMDHGTINMNNMSNMYTPSRLRLFSTTPIGINPCGGVYNKRDSNIPHVLSNSEVNQLLTQSSYRPSSPDYQSLDAIWCHQNKFSSGTMNMIHRQNNNHNNINNSEFSPFNNNGMNHFTHRLPRKNQKLLPTHYALGNNNHNNNSDNHVKSTLNNGQQPMMTMMMMMSNDFTESSGSASASIIPTTTTTTTPAHRSNVNTFLPHTYYEITTPSSDTWHHRGLSTFISNEDRILDDGGRSNNNNETHVNFHAHNMSSPTNNHQYHVHPSQNNHNNNINNRLQHQQQLTDFQNRSYNHHIATLSRAASGKARRRQAASTTTTNTHMNRNHTHHNDDSMYNLQAGELAIHSVRRSIQPNQNKSIEQHKIESDDKLSKLKNINMTNGDNCDNINKVVNTNNNNNNNVYHDGDNVVINTATTTNTTNNDISNIINEQDNKKLQDGQLTEQQTNNAQHYTYQAFREGTFV
ncbi:unnamed protein product [Schistosoma turkestanicum]|nr:unnamed protein product [Schistosoma turkestanicum]